MSNPFNALALLAVVAVAILTTGCAGFNYSSPDKMDQNDVCLQAHVWEQTTASRGRNLGGCPGWYRERIAKDQ